MRRICVFCGSSPGTGGEHLATASRFGELLAERGFGLVYGGARIGLMGALADAAAGRGAEVIGVMLQDLLDKEGHSGLKDLRVAGSFHERKAMMSRLSDGFVALPGGLGTIDELCDVAASAQLGLHRKPCGLLNAGGYYDRFLGFLDHAAAQGFISAGHRGLVFAAPEPEALLDWVAARIVAPAA